MCLGIPGRILETYQQNELLMGKVDFGGVAKQICLAYTPEAKPGDYVIVHVGFAISQIDEAEAQEIFSYLEEIGQVAEEEALAERAGEESTSPSPSGRGSG